MDNLNESQEHLHPEDASEEEKEEEEPEIEPSTVKIKSEILANSGNTLKN